MADKALPIEYDLGENGGTFSFRTLKQFADGMAQERAKWEWVTGLLDGDGHGNLPSRVLSQLNDIVRWAERKREDGSFGGDSPEGVLSGHYGGSPPLLIHSRSATGTALFAIREQLGDRKAALAYALIHGQRSFDWQVPEHLQLVMMVSAPSLIKATARAASVSERLDGVYRYGEELTGEQAAMLEHSRGDWEAFKRDARSRARRVLRKAHRYNRLMREQTAASAQAAIASIESTDAAFGERMQLEAAVNYWGEKRGSHAKQRGTAFKTLAWFMAIAGIAATLAFTLAAFLLLEMAGVKMPIFELGRASTDTPLPTVSYLVITAFLGTLLTCLFWAARILVRIYLSERTLLTDSEERLVMIKTYLALIKEGGALKDEDRLVILNALFRSAGDGNSGQDSGGEVALPALMARLIDQRPSG
jgi:Family of unknown function (DUF6161)